MPISQLPITGKNISEAQLSNKFDQNLLSPQNVNVARRAACDKGLPGKSGAVKFAKTANSAAVPPQSLLQPLNYWSRLPIRFDDSIGLQNNVDPNFKANSIILYCMRISPPQIGLCKPIGDISSTRE